MADIYSILRAILAVPHRRRFKRTPGERVNSEGFRGFKSTLLRQRVPRWQCWMGRVAEAHARLPGVRASNVTQFASNEDRKRIVQPAANGNRVLEELRDLDPRFRDPRCSQCRQTAQIAITNEGIVVSCKNCTKIERVDTDTLQHLVDRLAATCFSCISGKLNSMARSFGNILKCQNRECGRNNSWQGLSERIRR
jgi:hypothetical protein